MSWPRGRNPARIGHAFLGSARVEPAAVSCGHGGSFTFARTIASVGGNYSAGDLRVRAGVSSPLIVEAPGWRATVWGSDHNSA